MKKVMALAVAMLLTSCSVDDDTARRVLDLEGYTDIELLGWSPLSCSNSETRSGGFRATRDGRSVEGVVCCAGYFWGDCTVRH